MPCSSVVHVPRETISFMRVLIVFLLLVLPLGHVPAGTGSDEDRSDLSAAVAAGDIVPLSELLDWLEARYRGQVIEVDLEEGDDRLVYNIGVLGPSGQRVTFRFDATTGALFGIEGVRVREMMRESRSDP